MECCCHMRNVLDRMADGKRALEKKEMERTVTDRQLPLEYWYVRNQSPQETSQESMSLERQW